MTMDEGQTPPGLGQPPKPPRPPVPPQSPLPPPLMQPITGSLPGDTLVTPGDTRPEPGDLKIQGRRAWKTWQLTIFLVVAFVIGMWFNGISGTVSTGVSGSATGSSGGSYKLPPPSGSGDSSTTTGARGSTTTTTAGAAGGAPGSTTTPSAVAGGASGSTTTTTGATVGPASVLVPAFQSTGNWTSPAFTIAGGTWNIGWAFACTPVPASTPTFAVFVVNNGASPGPTPAVSSGAPSGQSATPLTSTGSQQIVVQAPAGCRWVVKVTGSSS